jgi:hypothetical protein
MKSYNEIGLKLSNLEVSSNLGISAMEVELNISKVLFVDREKSTTL